MIYWAPLLHFYQPPTQISSVLGKVCEESYRPLLELFRQHPHAKFTMNMNGVLTGMLQEHGYSDIIEGFRELAARGQIEFTGSGVYHPILPLLPKGEMGRQIGGNYLTNRRFLGELYRPKGFFPPEMAFDQSIVGPVIETGHSWIVVSGVACPVEWPMDVIHEITHEGYRLAVFFRDDILSNKISFGTIDGPGFVQHLKQLRAPRRDSVYVVTAMDAETFGHHVPNWEKFFLATVYEALEPKSTRKKRVPEGRPPVPDKSAASHSGDKSLEPMGKTDGETITAVTISELLDLFPPGKVIEPKASSWSTSPEDLAAGTPYPLWKDPKNAVHQLLWRHLALAIELVNTAEAVADGEESKRAAANARGLLDMAFHSDQFWWASKRPWWDLSMVLRGLHLQEDTILNGYQAIKASGADEDVKRQAYYMVVVARDISHKITDRLLEERE